MNKPVDDPARSGTGRDRRCLGRGRRRRTAARIGRTCTWPARRPTPTTCPNSPARCTRRSACRRWRTAGSIAHRPGARPRACPAWSAVLTAGDIPGVNDCGPIVHDDPILAPSPSSRRSALARCATLGQPVFAVVATTRDARAPRRRAGAGRSLTIEPLPPVLTPQEAHAARPVRAAADAPGARGDAAARAAIAAAPHRSLAQLRRRRPGAVLPGRPDQLRHPARGRRHAGALLDPAPERDAAPGRACAAACASHHVQVECRRMGGGFGGKESQSALFACVAAVAAARAEAAGQAAARPRRRLPGHRPAPLLLVRVRSRLRRRRPHARRRGRRMVSRAGHSADLSGPVMTRALCHFDNAYWLPRRRDARLFGQDQHPEQHRLPRLRRAAGRDRHRERCSTASRAGSAGTRSTCGAPTSTASATRNVTPYGQTRRRQHHPRAGRRTRGQQRLPRAGARRSRPSTPTSPVLKTGLALTPVKFGISFNVTHLNQAGALVHVYADGSVLVNHGGTEMGQGLNTKVAQVVAHELGVPLAQVRVHRHRHRQGRQHLGHRRLAPAADLNGKAAQDAARQIRERLAACAGGTARRRRRRTVRFADDQVASDGRSIAFASWSPQAYLARVQLWSDGFYATPGLHWDRDDDAGPAVLLLRLRRGGQRGGGRHADRRMAAAARRRAARRRPLAEPGHRHRPGRRRLHPGHGLADHAKSWSGTRRPAS